MCSSCGFSWVPFLESIIKDIMCSHSALQGGKGYLKKEGVNKIGGWCWGLDFSLSMAPLGLYYSGIWTCLCTSIMTFIGIFAINSIFYPSLPHQFSEWFFFLSIYTLILVMKYSSEAQVKTVIFFSQSSNPIIKVLVFFPKKEKNIYIPTYVYRKWLQFSNEVQFFQSRFF